MSESPLSSPLEKTVVIVGVGLIGGSLAAVLKQKKLAQMVIGVGRDAKRIEAARLAGIIDEATTDIATVIDRADLVVFCTPVDHLAADVRKAEAALVNKTTGSSSTRLLFTDVGSVKTAICESLADIPRFIGSHPIAGSHRRGFEAADPHLFEERICVITPLPSSELSEIQRIERFWQAVGMRTVQMTPSAHDKSLAMTSHLPHVVAAALATTLAEENRLLIGTGFRDTTRVAAGDPDLWTGILMDNANSIVQGIDDVIQNLTDYREAMQKKDKDAIRKLLEEGHLSRSALDQSQDILNETT